MRLDLCPQSPLQLYLGDSFLTQITVKTMELIVVEVPQPENLSSRNLEVHDTLFACERGN